MVLLKIHTDRVAVFPLEGHTPGPVHVQAVANKLAVEPVEVEARNVQVREQDGLVKYLQPDGSPSLKVRSDAGRLPGLEELAEPGVPEASNHFG